MANGMPRAAFIAAPPGTTKDATSVAKAPKFSARMPSPFSPFKKALFTAISLLSSGERSVTKPLSP